MPDLADEPWRGGGPKAGRRSALDPGSTDRNFSCPADDGSFVQAWFATAHGEVSYRVELAGGRFLRPRQDKLKDFGTWPEGMPTHT